MDVNATSLQKQLEAMRFEASGSQSVGGVQSQVTTDFTDMLRQALTNVNELQQTSKDMQTRYDMGDQSLNLSDVVIAGQKASVAFEATVQVRNKIVEAYKTIMNMPV